MTTLFAAHLLSHGFLASTIILWPHFTPLLTSIRRAAPGFESSNEAFSLGRAPDLTNPSTEAGWSGAGDSGRADEFQASRSADSHPEAAHNLSILSASSR